MIFSCAFQLSKTMSLADVSIVKVARELRVTPALIHYYVGGRDALTSAVMNAFYKEMLEDWPLPVGDWKIDIEAVADNVYRAFVRYGGVAAYVMSHNRFRMFQDVRQGETEYGVLVFEKFVSAVRQAGFDAPRTAMYSHLLMEFIIANAHTTVRHRWPGEHSDFLNKKLADLDPEAFPATRFVWKSFTQLNAAAVFSMGLRVFLKALELRSKDLPEVAVTAPSSAA
jgi:AcrR family transcriptional regulator